MPDRFPHDEPKPAPDIRKEEPTVVQNIRNALGCMPVLGSIAVGVGGLIAFGVGMQHTSDLHGGAQWLIAASLGLIASGIGFGVLAWLVWGNRDR